jgi:hypothetical protein
MLGLFDTAQHGWASIADVGRRIELSARGERFTTILHEIVRLGRTVALERVLDRGVDPSVLDSDGATPMHRLDGRSDHLNPEIVSALSAAGADVNSTTPGGQRPIEAAAQRILPAGGAVVTPRDRELATEAAVSAVISALDA